MRTLLLLLMTFLPPLAAAQAAEKTAVFAGGCFWCMEKPFDDISGVLSTTSGYAGGSTVNPTYEEVSQGGTGHIEVVRVVFDDATTDYQTLLETYWANVDPLDGGGQFCDRGESYKSAIFHDSPAQKKWALASKKAVGERLSSTVETDVRPLNTFYPAEDYHQDYYSRNAVRYKYYRWRCGRDARLEELWGEQATKALPLFNQ